jgi:hypothetical protein
MPWTAQHQTDAEQRAEKFRQEYVEKMNLWYNSIWSSDTQVAAKQAAVNDVIDRWQKSLNSLQAQSNQIMSNENLMDGLGQLATKMAEEKVTLQKLRGEAGTRDNQADSVNPKVRGSPYTNILWLNRTFRESTRSGILAASIVFGALSLSALGFLVYNVMTKESSQGYIAAGGAKK